MGPHRQKMKNHFVIKDLVKAGVHLGHQTNKWNPRTSSYLFAIKDQIHIIDLEQSILMFRRALQFIQKICSKRGNILYIPYQSNSKKGVLVEVLNNVSKNDYDYKLDAEASSSSKDKKKEMESLRLSFHPSDKNYITKESLSGIESNLLDTVTKKLPRTNFKKTDGPKRTQKSFSDVFSLSLVCPPLHGRAFPSHLKKIEKQEVMLGNYKKSKFKVTFPYLITASPGDTQKKGLRKGESYQKKIKNKGLSTTLIDILKKSRPFLFADTLKVNGSETGTKNEIVTSKKGKDFNLLSKSLSQNFGFMSTLLKDTFKIKKKRKVLVAPATGLPMSVILMIFI